MYIIFKNAIEVLIRMYSLLHEEDILESLFKSTIKCMHINKAFSLEQQGCFKEASLIYIQQLKSKSQKAKNPNAKVVQFNNCNIHNEFLIARLTK